MVDKKNTLFIWVLILGFISIIMGVFMIVDMMYGLLFIIYSFGALLVLPIVGITLSIKLYLDAKKDKLKGNLLNSKWALAINILGILLLILARIIDNSSGFGQMI